MSYVSPIQQKQSIADLLKDKPSNARPSEKDVAAFSKALAPPLQLAETTVIELIDGGPGHAALHIDDDGKGSPFLYDPAGSYMPKNGVRSSDLMLGEDASLANYTKFWQDRKDTVHLHKLDTTPMQEQAIMKRAEQIGSVPAPLCASSVSKALDGVCGIEGSVWPSTLGKNVDHANCK